MLLRLAALVVLCFAAVQAVKHNTVGRNEIFRTVRAVFNQLGVTGEVLFTQERPGAPVDIQVNLVGLDQFSDDYRWSIHQFPVRTSLLMNYPCTNTLVGGVFNPANPSGTPPSCAGAPQLCAVGDLTSKLMHLRNVLQQTFSDPNLDLFGPQSIVGRSLVIDRQDGPTGAFICANIELNGRPSRRVETLRASFNNDVIQGDVIVRVPTGFDETTIEADIYRVDGVDLNGQNISWSLNFGPATRNCTNVGVVFGSSQYNPASFACSMAKQRECIIGDLTSKCGVLNFVNARARAYCTDTQLGTVNMQGILPLFVRIRDSSGNDLGCAPFTTVRPLRADAQFRGVTEFGEFTFYQDSPDDETYVKAFVTGLSRQRSPYRLRIFQNAGPTIDPCNATLLGGMYRAPGRALFTSTGVLTADSCVLGNLDNYLPIAANQGIQTTIPTSIPLFGPFSVIGRTIGLVDSMGNIVACSVITNSCTTCIPTRYSSLQGYQQVNNPSAS